MNFGEAINWTVPAFAIAQNVLRNGYTVTISDPDDVLDPGIIKARLARVGIHESWGWDCIDGQLVFSVPKGSEAQIDEMMGIFGARRKSVLAAAWLWIVALALLVFAAWAAWPMVGAWFDRVVLPGGVTWTG